ncbi:MAG: hypothetical protein ABI076_03790, partial [Acidobacteriaceae bacterium]
MVKRLLTLALFLSLPVAVLGQAMTTITATNVLVDNGSGTAIHPPSGSQLCFVGVNGAGVPITYTPSGYGPVSGPVCGTLNSSGALSGSLLVGNPATSTPNGLLYTITVTNGTTAYLTVPTVTLSGSVWSFDSYAVSDRNQVIGLGYPHIACAGGASWTSTTLPPGQANATCSGSGSWLAYPPATYCPAGQAYAIPQGGGMPMCQSPTLQGNGSPTGSCTQNSLYLQQDSNTLYYCKSDAWASISGGGGGYTLPEATASVLGGVKCGSGTSCTAGVISATGSGGLPPDGTTIVNKGGDLSTNSVKIENTFSSASTINYVHDLSDEYPVFTCYSKSGAAVSTTAPVDANTMAVTSYGAADILCSFIATQPQKTDFSFAVTPNTKTYVPTMGGTQTPTFAIAQTAISGYTGTATYSTTGLASGMSSSYSPSTITGSGSNTLSVSFPATQAAATTTFSASATDGTNTHTQPVAITINGLNTNLTEGWQMNEGSGTTFSDATSNANNVTFASGIGSWGTVAGYPGSVFTFNGTGIATAGSATPTNFDGTAPF